MFLAAIPGFILGLVIRFIGSTVAWFDKGFKFALGERSKIRRSFEILNRSTNRDKSKRYRR